MRRLFVPGYYCGFSNNKMSLDIAIVLAYLTGRVLVPYRFRMPRRFPADSESGQVPEPMLVPELFDIPVTWSAESPGAPVGDGPGGTSGAWRPRHPAQLLLRLHRIWRRGPGRGATFKGYPSPRSSPRSCVARRGRRLMR